ncbi:MAG: hypothetical protein AAFP28_12070 [Pseudomonadota bacterium]
MARGVGPTRNTNAVKNALRHCRRDPCECLADAINRLVEGHDTGQGWNKGIQERIDTMLSPGADPPGTMYNGRDTFQTHQEQISQRQQGADNLLQEYDAQGCGGGGGGAAAIDREATTSAINAPVPTADDYWDRYPDRRPATSSGPSNLARVGYAVGGTLALIGAGALLFVPFDGPFGEAAAGAAGVGMWGLATQ